MVVNFIKTLTPAFLCQQEKAWKQFWHFKHIFLGKKILSNLLLILALFSPILAFKSQACFYDIEHKKCHHFLLAICSSNFNSKVYENETEPSSYYRGEYSAGTRIWTQDPLVSQSKTGHSTNCAISPWAIFCTQDKQVFVGSEWSLVEHLFLLPIKQHSVMLNYLHVH